MSANSTSARASFPANLSSRTRGIMLPWLAYIVTFIILLPPLVWDDSTAHFILYLRLLVAITVALKLLLPRKPGHLALYDSRTALFLLALPVLFTQGFMMFRWSEDVNVWLGAAYLLTTLVPCIFCVSFGALIAAVFGAKPLQWPAVFLAPTLYPRWWLRMLPDASVYNNIFLYEGSSLLVSIPAALAAWTLWTPQSASAENLASNNLTREIFRKELRLQKNNIFFTIATLILGVIGLMSINAADPSVGFNPDDIRDALTYIIILPLLTLILPLMIGSTAAAAEKPLGVQAWQTALPISLWRATLMKFLVITGLIFIISGVLPYVFTLIASDTPSVNSVFRHTWPFWLAFLCAAIGYYSGTLARDDYQGLLISILPITLLILTMTYADPLRLVFPAYIGWQEPLLKQHILAARLLLIAAIFIIGTMQVQRRPGQKMVRLITAQAGALVIGTFILTLVNIVGERTALRQPHSESYGFTGLYPRSGALPIPPQPIASVGKPSGSYNISFDQDSKLPFAAVSGKIERRYHAREYNVVDTPYHVFLTLPGATIREFPQAVNSHFIGLSANGRWLLAIDKQGYPIFCGPAGLTLHSKFLPKVWFDYFQVAIGAVTVDNLPQRSLATLDVQIQWPVEVKGNDLLVQAEARGAIQIKNGASQIPHPKQRWYRVNLLNDHFILTMKPQNTDTTTQTAILKPLPEHGFFEIESIVTGDIGSMSPDRKWATVGTGWPDIVLCEVFPKKQNTIAGNAARKYILRTVRPQNDGTTITIDNRVDRLQIMTVKGTPYAAWKYNMHGPVTIGSHTVANEMWLSSGALVLNLETGIETLIPFKFSWHQQTSLDLLENFRKKNIDFSNWEQSNFTVHPQGAIAASHLNMVAIVKPNIHNWGEDVIYGTKPNNVLTVSTEKDVTYIASTVPSRLVTQIRFLTKDELIATDGTTVYQIKPAPSPRLLN